MRPLRQYSYQQLRFETSTSGRRPRSRWKALMSALALVGVFGVVVLVYVYDANGSTGQLRFVSRWRDRLALEKNPGEGKDKGAVSVDDKGPVLLEHPFIASPSVATEPRLIYPSSGAVLAVKNFDPFARKFPLEDLDKRVNFKINESDIIVNLHIQKTGGSTFGRHLVRHLNVDPPCECYKQRKRCDCFRPQNENEVWLFSRFTVGWRCGLHADWTELIDCVPKALNKMERTSGRHRRYLYVTMLRDPVQRYLSEFRHVQRGATWKKSLLHCNGRSASEAEVPYCFSGDNWANVSLEEFMACPSNLATNRQTRMISNLTKVGCYDSSNMSIEQRNALMFESATENLRNMTFFGLTEYQKETQELFEWTFGGIRFVQSFKQKSSSHASETGVTHSQMTHLFNLNALDIELYRFAASLFFQRVAFMKAHPLDLRVEDGRWKEVSPTFDNNNFSGLKSGNRESDPEEDPEGDELDPDEDSLDSQEFGR